jgi:hypothetical protein
VLILKKVLGFISGYLKNHLSILITVRKKLCVNFEKQIVLGFILGDFVKKGILNLPI